MCITYMCTYSSWSLFWSSLAFKTVRLHSSQSFTVLAGLSEVRLRGRFWVIDDLPGCAIAHSSLRCSFICAHLQPNDIFAFRQLFLREISSVLLGLPAHVQTHISEFTVSILSTKMKLFFDQLFRERIETVTGNSPRKPAGISFVITIVLLYSQTC